MRDIHSILNSIEISQGGSNTDSGSKRGVCYRYITNLYLAFIVRNFFWKIQKNKIWEFSFNYLFILVVFVVNEDGVEVVRGVNPLWDSSHE